MPTTYVDYTATAAQTDFAFNFDYLEDEHVIVEINGSATTDFTIVTSPAKKVVLNSGATAGDVVRVRRKSQPNTNLVDFVNGSVLTESELDRAYQHNRFLNEEIAELNDASLQLEAGGTQWDGKSLRIKNVDTPTETADAATKNYVDTKVNQVSSGASFPPTKWVFTGDAGANTTYSVTGAEILGDTAYDVSIDGAVKEPTTDYTVDPDTDTLTIVPTLSGGEDIVVIERGFGIAISTGTIGSSQISTNAVTTNKIADDQVTYAKIQNVAANNVLLGNDSGAGQDVQELTAGEVRTLLNVEDGANNFSLADNAVTFAKIQNINTAKVIGRTTAGSGTPEEVSILDEDAMTSNSSTALATQQSIKAYVDAQASASVFTSSETAIPATNVTETWTHGLGQAPDLIQLILRCKTAEYGYSVGDEIRFTSEYTAASAYNLWATSTQIGLRGFITSGVSIFHLVRRDATGSLTQATPANWKIVVKGIVF